MDREIKFRAWSLGKMLTHQELRRYEEDEPGVLFNMFDNAYESTYIMQYTGLKDRNGREIYEGDIVTSIWCDCPENTEHEVTYEDACLYAGKHELAKYEFEVIGNIYEKPELLEQTK